MHLDPTNGHGQSHLVSVPFLPAPDSHCKVHFCPLTNGAACVRTWRPGTQKWDLESIIAAQVVVDAATRT